ncbi:hypothetical protein [Methylobacterium planeticum]|uniref:Uncharacterized protein n=1 Tax=Methylobacterium planeticum TaxID=2615211 RepID=A0A6N6MQH3_9HYPH|nr:hypothetical protein [Methylobacterium planeticum]KAB1072953.1 hypothetical protein F6X51_13270 [Methylobacterium planeticum]
MRGVAAIAVVIIHFDGLFGKIPTPMTLFVAEGMRSLSRHWQSDGAKAKEGGFATDRFRMPERRSRLSLIA